MKCSIFKNHTGYSFFHRSIKFNVLGQQYAEFLVNRDKITMVFMFTVYSRFNDWELRAFSILAQNVEDVSWIPTTRDFPDSWINFFLSLCTAF